MEDIFISYSRKDKAFGSRLHEALKTRERDAWVDLEDIPPTAEWREKIKAGIEGARAFVFLLSPDSMTSSECLKEIEHAAASHKRLIPVVCREVNARDVPEVLACLNWILMREQDDFERAIDTLLTAVDTDLEWVDAHTNLLQKATEWNRKGRDKSLLLRGRELRQAEEWQVKGATKEPKPTELQGQFILSSRHGETSRQRKLLSGVVAGLVVAITLAVVAFFQYREADRRGRIALSRQLAAQGSNLVGKDSLDLALLLSLASGKIWETMEARSSLLSALVHEPFPLTFLHGHRMGVKTLTFSPDGKVLASGGDDKTILLWDVATQKPVGSPLAGHSEAVTSIAFSPDGKTLASASSDKTVLLWDLETRNPAGSPLLAHSDRVFSLTFSPDGKLLASGSKGTIILWDVNSHLPMAQPPTGNAEFVSTLAFSPDGKLLASGDKKNIIFWDTISVAPVGTPLEHPGWVYSVAFSPEGKRLISAHVGNEIIHWDVSDCKMLKRFKPESDTVRTSAAFNTDARMLISGAYDNTITLWDLEKQQPLVKPLKSHARRIDAIAISPNGEAFASASRDGCIILWDLSDNRVLCKNLFPVERVKGPDGKITARTGGVVISPDGKTVAQVVLNKMEIDMEEVGRLEQRLPAVSDVQYGKEITSRLSPKALTPEKEISITLRSRASGQPMGPPLSGLDGAKELSEVVFSADGKLLATVKDSTIILLWEVATQKLLGTLSTGSDTRVWCLTFSPDGKILASGQRDSTDNTIVLRELTDLKPVEILSTGQINWNISLAFSPDGKVLASGDQKGSITFWDVGMRTSLGTPQQNHSLPVDSLAFSPDGRILASGSWDQTVVLWDVTTRTPLGPPLTGHSSRVKHVRFNPDGKVLASVDLDGSVILWDVDTRMPLGSPLKGPLIPTYLSFSSDGKILTSSNNVSRMTHWEVSPEAWKNWVCRMANRNLTHEEWRRYLGDEPYQLTCPNLPAPVE